MESFYKQLSLSSRTYQNYKKALESRFVKQILNENFGVSEVFEIIDLDSLWKLYSMINLHPQNISNHRAYSAAIMKYIKYLNGGKRYGKRVDYQKPKPRINRQHKDSI